MHPKQVREEYAGLLQRNRSENHTSKLRQEEVGFQFHRRSIAPSKLRTSARALEELLQDNVQDIEKDECNIQPNWR